MSRKSLLAVYALTVISVLGSLQAQTVQGSIAGTVTDESGAVVPKVALKLTNDQTNVSQAESSGSSGAYRFSLVPPGVYTLTAKVAGFTEKQIKNITVKASTPAEVNFSLNVASASTVVEVQEQATMAQTASAELASNVNTRSIENLPLPTRNVFDLAFLVPQVSPGMDGNPTAGGLRQASTSYLLNGAENNFNFSAGAYNITPPLESVSEFTIVTNSMSAQYGRGAGAIISTLQKSGTNEIHGALYEFNRNRAFNADDFFSNRDGAGKPAYNRNQFGGAVGGPIKKDKTFWYFAFDRIDVHTSYTLSQQVPTSSEWAQVKAGAGPLASQIVAKLAPPTSDTPCPNQSINAPDSIGHVGCVTLTSPNPTTQNSYYFKLDHNFSANDRLAVSINVGRGQTLDTYGGANLMASGPVGYSYLYPGHNATLDETHTFSPRAINELTISNIRAVSSSLYGSQVTNSLPEILIDGTNYGGFGWNMGGLEGDTNSFIEGRWNAVDNFSFTTGRHTVKVGGSFQIGNLYRNWDLGAPGQYEFANVFGPTAAASGAVNANGTIGPYDDYTVSNFVNDLPYYMETSVNPANGQKADAYRHYYYKDAAIFVQDDIRVSRRLTVNLGLRWERFQAPKEQQGIISQFTNWNGSLNVANIAAARVGQVSSMWHTRNKDLGPRVGFAYDVFGDGSTSLRGGYGISFDRIFDNVWSNGAWNPPFFGLLDLDASGSDAIYYSLPISAGASYTPNSIPSASVPVSVRTMQQDLKDTSAQNLYFSLERQVKHDFLIRLNYQASLGRHLPVLENINRYDGQKYNVNLSNPGRPNPLYTGFNYRANQLTSNYNALIAEVQKRYSNGLQFQASYTWSHLLDYGSEVFTGETSYGANSQPYYFVSNTMPRSYEYGSGAFDHRHGFKASFVYDLPFLKSQKGLIGQTLGGWTATAFYQGYSGHPLEIYSSRASRKGNAKDANGNYENIAGDYNLDGVANDRPNFVGSSASAAYSGWNPADGIFKDNARIGCGYVGMASTNAASTCANVYGVSTPNTLFVNPPGYGPHYGALGRNAFRGPWFNGLNGSLHKNFSLERLREGAKLQFRAEAINLLNHANFDNVNTDLNSATFGRALSLAGNDATETGIARRFQFGARVTF